MDLTGFGNYHQSESVPGALPLMQNAPQQCPLGLYGEQLSGSAFTRPRHVNLRSWLYRLRPSAAHHDYKPYSHQPTHSFAPLQSPNPMRWSPLPALTINQNFVDGLFHVAGNALINAYLYQCNRSMTTQYFCNRDGEMLFVPYQGGLRLHTEFGLLDISPGMIAVIPRGVMFNVELLDSTAAGYLCENAATPLTLPSLGPIGSSGLAHPRHFVYPTAATEESQEDVTLICKYQHHWWAAKSDHSPLDVVAWHGNYAPYCYDLSKFNTINTVSFDHPDPSIFTVLTSESDTPGVANFDFVIFPPRWMVAEHTFRPPYFHRNVMSELMGLIQGTYDAKKEGFSIGGMSIHNCMTPHGPDAASYKQASQHVLKPEYYADTLAFMFETREPWKLTENALVATTRQSDYSRCWDDFKS